MAEYLNDENKIMEDNSSRFLLLAASVFLLWISMLFQSRSGAVRLTAAAFSQTMVFAFLGMLHGLFLFLHKRNLTGCADFMDFLSYFFMGWAFYSVVLLPLSGFGCAQWVVVAIYLISAVAGAIGKPEVGGRKIFASQSTLWLFIFGSVMLVFKSALYWFSPDNLYIMSVAGNKTLRLLLATLCIVGLVFLIAQLVSRGKTVKSNSTAAEKVIRKVGEGISSAGRAVSGLILSIFSGPVVLILILAAVLIFAACNVLLVSRIYKDLLSLVEPLLDRLLTTGENSVPPGTLHGLCQLTAYVCIMIFHVWFYLHLEKNEENGWNENAAGKNSVKKDAAKSAVEKTSVAKLKENKKAEIPDATHKKSPLSAVEKIFRK